MYTEPSASAARSSSVILGESCLSATSSDRTDSCVRVEHRARPGFPYPQRRPVQPAIAGQRQVPRVDHEAAVGHAPDRTGDVVRVKPLAHGAGLDGRHAAQADFLVVPLPKVGQREEVAIGAIAAAVVTARRAQRKQLGDRASSGARLSHHSPLALPASHSSSVYLAAHLSTRSRW